MSSCYHTVNVASLLSVYVHYTVPFGLAAFLLSVVPGCQSIYVSVGNFLSTNGSNITVTITNLGDKAFSASFVEVPFASYSHSTSIPVNQEGPSNIY